MPTYHPDELYRVRITWKKTRPYYPDRYVVEQMSRLTHSQDFYKEYYDADRANVGETFEYVSPAHRSKGTVKAQVTKAFNAHPFANIYGDNLECYEIISEVWEHGTMVWKEEND